MTMDYQNGINIAVYFKGALFRQFDTDACMQPEADASIAKIERDYPGCFVTAIENDRYGVPALEAA